MDLLPHNRAAYDAIQEALATSSRTCVIHPTGTGKSYIAMAYIEEHSDEPILFITSYAVDRHNLHVWLKAQRQKKQSLSPEQIQKLNDIGLIWEVEILWEKTFKKMKEFKEEHGHLFLTDQSLLKWAANQRYFNLLGKHLTPGKKEKLDRLGFDWDSDHYWAELRNFRGLNASRKYFEKHGDLLAPYGFKIADEYGEFGLGRWLLNIRKEKERLSVSTVQELESLGMVWDAKKYHEDVKWEKGFRHAEQYCNNHQDLLVKKEYRCNDGFYIGSWIANRRRQFQEGNFDGERKARLDSIGMEWSSGDLPASWLKKYRQAEKYYKEHGNLLLTEKTEFSNWINFQRRERRAGHISATQINMLDSIGMIWDRMQASPYWLKTLTVAKEYYNEHGNLNLKTMETYHDVKLGDWLARQRTKRRSGKLSDYQIRQLDKLGMDWGDPLKPAGVDYTKRWYKNYLIAKQYYEEHGSLDVPSSFVYKDFPLGTWISSQRGNRYNNTGVTISEEQISLLDAIGMVWRKEDEWRIHYEKLKETGLVNPDYIDDTGFPLGHWYYRQRSNYNRGLLSEERIRLLEELGVSWSEKRDEETGATARWMQWYALCEQYVREHGDFRISGSFVLPDGTRLGKWVKRTRYEKHKLNEKQIELLDRIGMVWAVRTPKGGGKDEN